MTTLAQLHDCHSCNDERSIVQKKNRFKKLHRGKFHRFTDACFVVIFSSVDLTHFYILVSRFELQHPLL